MAAVAWSAAPPGIISTSGLAAFTTVFSMDPLGTPLHIFSFVSGIVGILNNSRASRSGGIRRSG